jgi:hypothetical protein
MANNGKKSDSPSFNVRSLSPDHPLNDNTPSYIHAITRNMLGLLMRLTAMAKFASEKTPSRTGFYPITLFFNAKGDVLCDEDGVAVVAVPSWDMLAVDPKDGIIFIQQANQLVKRAEAAEIAGTSVSTLKRAEVSGELRAVKVSERDTSYFMADLNAWMMRDMLKTKQKG